MKTHIALTFLAFCGIMSAAEYLRPDMEALHVPQLKLDAAMSDPAWSKTKEYPLLKLAKEPKDFGVMPREDGRVRLLADQENLYVGAVFADTDVVTDAKAPSRNLGRQGDALVLLLRPLNDTGFFEFLIAPNGLVSCVWVPGGGVDMLPGHAQESLSIPVQITINGKLNDWHGQDVSWQAVVTVPMRKIQKLLRDRGVCTDFSRGWSILAGRWNYSRALDKVERSCFPQTGHGFNEQLWNHARLVLCRQHR